MKVLVIGGGGREHALCWAINKSPKLEKLWCAPGNAGIAQIAECLPIKADDITGLTAWCEKQKPDLVVVGPEAPLAAGLADVLRDKGIAVFGPGRDGARIEASKAFAKELMLACNAPTAKHKAVENLQEAVAAIDEMNGRVVVKADGLAAGKGVIVCNSREEAIEASRQMLEGGIFGAAGKRLVIEERLSGPELSYLALTDGERLMPLAPAQDHKRLKDDDKGPNTGGMGAYSPASPGAEVLQEIEQKIMQPVLQELRKRGINYRGVIYAGLMLSPQGPKVLEFNCRFGDPETQAILPLLDEDLLPLLDDCARGRLQKRAAKIARKAAVCVVMAAAGYPEKPKQGDIIKGLENAASQNAIVFHAGTKQENQEFLTAGGRVLGVTGLGPDIESARKSAYDTVKKISFDGAQFRSDIAKKYYSKVMNW